MTDHHTLYIPVASVASSQASADATDVIAGEDQQRQDRLERQRLYRDANREKIRAAGRAHYRANRQRILAQQAEYRRTPAGRATTKRANDKRRPKDPLQALAAKFAANQENLTNMHKPVSRASSGAKSPPKSSPRGRPSWLVAFAKENHVTLAELRQVSKLIARQRQVQREMAGLEARITARAKATKE